MKESGSRGRGLPGVCLGCRGFRYGSVLGESMSFESVCACAIETPTKGPQLGEEDELDLTLSRFKAASLVLLELLLETQISGISAMPRINWHGSCIASMLLTGNRPGEGLEA